MEFHLSVSKAKGANGAPVSIITITDQLNAATIPKIRQALYHHIDQQTPNVILDMSQVSFMDSSGLGGLVSALNHARRAGGNLYLCCLPDPIQQVLKLVGMDRVFIPYPSQAAALQSFSKSLIF